MEDKVTDEIVTIKLLSSICNLTLQEIAKLKKKYKNFSALRAQFTSQYNVIEKLIFEKSGEKAQIFSSHFLFIMRLIVESALTPIDKKKTAKAAFEKPLAKVLSSRRVREAKEDFARMDAAKKESIETGKPVFVELHKNY